MTRDKFRESLRIGLGRAAVYARDHDVSPFRDIIVDACLHCYSVDVQSEGTRAEYMYDLVNLLPDHQYYRDAVLSALPSGGDDHDAAQRFHFARCFALGRSAAAGLEALLPEAPSALVEASEANTHFRAGIWKEIAGLDYEHLKPKLPGIRFYLLNKWGREASTVALEQAAHGLLATDALDEQIQHLHLFANRPFPLDPEPLIEFSISPDDALARAASVALAQLKHPSTRDHAFRLVADRLVGRGWSIDMLRRNFTPGDHDVVLNWFCGESDPEVRHDHERRLLDFWSDHPEPESELRMLMKLYETGPCSFCREFVVRRLIEMDSLSSALREECAYDANYEVRELVGA